MAGAAMATEFPPPNSDSNKPWLSEAQKQSWANDGLLVVEGAFSPAEVAEMRAEADLILEQAVNSSLYHNRRSGRLDWRLREDGCVNN